ncbi:MAG: hypothetical protein M3441_16715 [Chloroflexota bacterium]|nr:hypothetical protein [Chloroflexota bacterium]
MSFLNGIHHNLRHATQPQQNKDLDAPGGEQDGAGVSARADVDAVAGAIEQAGLSVPATLALEVGKPLSWLGGQMLWVFQPFADVLGIRARKGPLSVEGVARMLEREGSTDALLERLDAGVTSRKKGGRR